METYNEFVMWTDAFKGTYPTLYIVLLVVGIALTSMALYKEHTGPEDEKDGLSMCMEVALLCTMGYSLGQVLN